MVEYPSHKTTQYTLAIFKKTQTALIHHRLRDLKTDSMHSRRFQTCGKCTVHVFQSKFTVFIRARAALQATY